MKDPSCLHYLRHRFIESQSEFFFITKYHLLQLDVVVVVVVIRGDLLRPAISLVEMILHFRPYPLKRRDTWATSPGTPTLSSHSPASATSLPFLFYWGASCIVSSGQTI